MNVAEFVAARLCHLGASDVFSVTGGAAMHLNRAFATTSGMRVHYLHHEQACAMAAEGFARIHWRPAVVCVTAGPGAINALNGVFGAFTDSVPMIVVSGQPRTETLAALKGLPQLRQLGDQESPIVEMVRPIVKAVRQVRTPEEVPAAVAELWAEAISDRPGPVWLDVPVDVQAMAVTVDAQVAFAGQAAAIDHLKAQLTRILERLTAAKRPLILAGTGVRIAGVIDELQRFAHAMQVPVATAWTHDVFDNDDALFAGRPGTIGTRAGNLVLQQADVILVLGSRLNIRQTGYAWDMFAPDAFIMQVDVDRSEMIKPYLDIDLAVEADLAQALPALAEAAPQLQGESHWLEWIRSIRARFEPRETDYPTSAAGINPYHFMMELDRLISSDAVLVCGNATACIVPFQTVGMSGDRRMFSNSGSASMGYDLPAAIGASVAAADRSIVCLAGDGSLMMNVQELATLAGMDADLALVVLENDGYLSIRQTQLGFFGEEHGTGPDSGVRFPDFGRLSDSFGLPTTSLSVDGDWRGGLRAFLDGSGPRVCVVHLDPAQGFEPRLKSRMTEAGIVSPALDDMFPFLEAGELQALRRSARAADGGEA